MAKFVITKDFIFKIPNAMGQTLMQTILRKDEVVEAEEPKIGNANVLKIEITYPMQVTTEKGGRIDKGMSIVEIPEGQFRKFNPGTDMGLNQALTNYYNPSQTPLPTMEETREKEKQPVTDVKSAVKDTFSRMKNGRRENIAYPVGGAVILSIVGYRVSKGFGYNPLLPSLIGFALGYYIGHKIAQNKLRRTIIKKAKIK